MVTCLFRNSNIYINSSTDNFMNIVSPNIDVDAYNTYDEVFKRLGEGYKLPLPENITNITILVD